MKTEINILDWIKSIKDDNNRAYNRALWLLKDMEEELRDIDKEKYKILSERFHEITKETPRLQDFVIRMDLKD